MLELFASDQAVERLEEHLNLAHGATRLRLLLALAWQLRQRDTARALALAAEAELLARNHAPPDGGHPPHPPLARLALVRGEAQWLAADFSAATASAEDALQRFSAANDHIGCADAHRLLSSAAFGQGDLARAESELAAMAAATAGHDADRQTAAQAGMARLAATLDLGAAKQRWAVLFTCKKNPHAPASACELENLWATAAHQSSDFGQSARHHIEAHKLALSTGQIRQAVLAACCVGEALACLNEHHAALEWIGRGLELARRSGWPEIIAAALVQTAEAMRSLARHDAARDLLREAQATLAALPDARGHADALKCLGEVELDCKEHSAALASFQALEQRAINLHHAGLRAGALRGQARALLHLDRPCEAQAAAETALELAGTRADIQIGALRVMADLHANHQLPDPPDMLAPSAPLHYLHQALAVASDIPGYIVPGDLLDAVARCYADAGKYSKAYEYAFQASSAREKTHSREATDRAVAMQVTHQTELARAEGERHRQLALSEARRAEALQHTSATLEHLGAIGQEITAHLDTHQVFAALNRHVGHLLEGTFMLAIMLVDESGTALDMAHIAHSSGVMPPVRVALDDPNSVAARCLRERREILGDHPAPDERSNGGGAPLRAASTLFAPLCVGERALGVMTAQSARRHAYGTREQLIFRSLCAYAAIAFSNCATHGDLAAAHRSLKETQQQLLRQEKMAGLGTLTAGVAHEINNPTNFAHVAAQNLQVDIDEFRQFATDLIEADEAPDVLEAFTKRFERLSRHVSTMLNGTGRIKNIVRDLRSFTRPEAGGKVTVRLSECLLSTLNLVRPSWLEKVTFSTELVDDPEIACWPALLSQVFMNLLVNGCQAIASKQGGDGMKAEPGTEMGTIQVRTRVAQGWLEITFTDNGIGMSAELRSRIMEPFFTTKPAGEGTGLGLSITYGIVLQHGGDLKVESEPGQGSCFTLRLPLGVGAG